MAAEPEQTSPSTDDPKEQFRQALERKKRQTGDGVGQTGHGQSPHGATDTHQHGGRREFRRKAGG
jgi:hypothetical protein